MSLSRESSLTEDHCETPAGDREEFERLLARNRHRIFRYIYSLVFNHSDAEDVMQRASLLMWRKFAEFDRTRSFLPWAYRIAFFEVRGFRRSRHTSRLMFSAKLIESLARRLERSPLPTQEDERLDALGHCLDRLSHRDRTLIHQVYWEGSDCTEVSDACGLTARTIYNRLHLIRRRLLECVQQRKASSPHTERDRLHDSEESETNHD